MFHLLELNILRSTVQTTWAEVVSTVFPNNDNFTEFEYQGKFVMLLQNILEKFLEIHMDRPTNSCLSASHTGAARIPSKKENIKQRLKKV